MSKTRLSEAGKRQHEVEVVKYLDLQIGEGEFMALVGPLGCTRFFATLRTIAGLESKSAGHLFISGCRANELTSAKHNASMDFQFRPPYPKNVGSREPVRRIEAEEAMKIGDAIVVRIQDLGHEAPRHLNIRRGAALTARASGEARGKIVPGATVPRAIMRNRLHAFDLATWGRLT